MADILKEIVSNLTARLIYLLYRLVLLALLPLVPFYFARRIARDRRYRHGFRQRLGTLPFATHPTPAASIWLHAVSVGEVLSAVTLVDQLRRLYPLAPLYVSCTTVAGRDLADLKLGGRVDGIFFAPLDYVRPVRRVLATLRPALVVILETEIWPNLYREVKRSGAALAIVNGRISDRAFPRYRWFNWFFGPVLAHADMILVQSETDRRRYIASGAPPDRVSLGGNLKFDFVPVAGEIAPGIQRFLDHEHPSRIWIAASTMPPLDSDDVDEDDIVIEAFLQLAPANPDLLLILAPRRPERFAVAASKLEASGLPFVRRSLLAPSTSITMPGVLLLDTIGELSRLFAIADVVFMGGTLARRGGHNILEPAFFGKPIIIGPHMENFAEIAAEFREAAAVVEIASREQLAPHVVTLLTNQEAREALGAKARRMAESKRGVAPRLAASLLELYDRTLPMKSGSPLLAPFAALWRAGVRRDRLNAKPRRLPAPVISIGNITLGGSGKTPVVDWLSEQLHAEGHQPAILTRGYRRRSIDRYTVVKAGTPCPIARTGDEAQIFVRRGIAHVGIGSDRFSTGNVIASQYGADAFLLDDGFEHWPLARDLDIVLIDALNPFGGGEVMPRGRLREPLDGLARADTFVITRCEPGLRTSAIEQVLRRYNPLAPIFRARMVPTLWVNAFTGEEVSLGAFEFKRVVAFCGLGNPTAFWNTLKIAAVPVVFSWSFSDHFSYRPKQLRQLMGQAQLQRADALVTTEKDYINLPGHLSADLKRVPVFWLKIEVEFEQPETFLELIHSCVIGTERALPPQGSR